MTKVDVAVRHRAMSGDDHVWDDASARLPEARIARPAAAIAGNRLSARLVQTTQGASDSHVVTGQAGESDSIGEIAHNERSDDLETAAHAEMIVAGAASVQSGQIAESVNHVHLTRMVLAPSVAIVRTVASAALHDSPLARSSPTVTVGHDASVRIVRHAIIAGSSHEETEVSVVNVSQAVLVTGPAGSLAGVDSAMVVLHEEAIGHNDSSEGSRTSTRRLNTCTDLRDRTLSTAQIRTLVRVVRTDSVADRIAAEVVALERAAFSADRAGNR